MKPESLAGPGALQRGGCRPSRRLEAGEFLDSAWSLGLYLGQEREFPWGWVHRVVGQETLLFFWNKTGDVGLVERPDESKSLRTWGFAMGWREVWFSLWVFVLFCFLSFCLS